MQKSSILILDSLVRDYVAFSVGNEPKLENLKPGDGSSLLWNLQVSGRSYSTANYKEIATHLAQHGLI